MGHKEHKKHRYSLNVGVITVSSTRDRENDVSGAILKDKITGHGHSVCGYEVVKDDKLEILSALFNMLKSCDAVIVNGGTGISRKDVTYDSVVSVFDKELVGFGELFRLKSYEEIGTPAMMSRATAGVVAGKIVFLTPGSPGAVCTASELIFAEIEHMWYELHKEKGTI
ncbi:MAG: MogA/MoaB family molybdenum cofactor biosynthesis protein [Euryarchaeota archaeon]|nr:MogA/MoaB family molybdenum cofactor biosynthesis protein [Euryarchaeota archaeon]